MTATQVSGKQIGSLAVMASCVNYQHHVRGIYSTSVIFQATNCAETNKYTASHTIKDSKKCIFM